MSILGPNKGYVDLLNEATSKKLTDDRASGNDFQKTPIRPSSAGNCTRELFYQLMEHSGRAKYEVEINSPETHRIFGLGHNVEYHVIDQFRLLSELFEIRYKQQVLSFAYLKAEKDPSLSQWLEGSLDLVFWSEKYKCVADNKSKKDKFSSFYKTAWDEMTEKLHRMRTVERISDDAFWAENLEAFLTELNDPFFEANFKQLNLYACSDFLRERGIDHAAIIQYSKNDSRLREVRFKPSLELAKKTIAKFQSVITAVDEGKVELATRDHMLGSFKCAFCKYKKECWPDKDARQAFFNSLPAKNWPRDTNRLGETGEQLEVLFEVFQEQDEAEHNKKQTEAAILKLMMQAKVRKLRLKTGEIYEARQLTNEIVLRRTKL